MGFGTPEPKDAPPDDDPRATSRRDDHVRTAHHIDGTGIGSGNHSPLNLVTLLHPHTLVGQDPAAWAQQLRLIATGRA